VVLIWDVTNIVIEQIEVGKNIEKHNTEINELKIQSHGNYKETNSTRSKKTVTR
jgi:hypothetical protein